jgi:hypothetical protein
MKLTHLRHPVILTSLAALFLICTYSAVLAQADTVNKQKNFPLEIAQQIDSPLTITPTVVEVLQPEVLTYRFTVKNLGDKKVEGFAISRSTEANDLRELTVFISPLAVGDDVDGWTNAIKADMNPESKILLAVDYVVFADGTSWGKDSRKESIFISAYPEGQKKALSEVKELIDKLDEPALARLLDRDLTITKLDSLGMDKSKPDKWKSGYAAGYQIVLFELKTIYKKQGISFLPSNIKTFNDLVKPIRVSM